MSARIIRLNLTSRAEAEEKSENWRNYAACGQIAPDLWFPEKGDRATADRARAICRERCEVREQCLDYALGDPDIHHGIWAGFNPPELRKLRRELGMAGAEIPPDMEPDDE